MKKFITVIVVILVIGLGVLGYLLFGNYSTGNRAGIVLKFSEKGYIFKTYEGELDLRPNAGQSLKIDPIWKFSVGSGQDSLIKIIDHAMSSGKKVELHYKEKFFHFFWRGDTKYFVDGAKISE
jgi:hypothetical protein